MNPCTCARCARSAELRLLGEGLDAIVQRATPPRRWWERLFGLRAITAAHMIDVPTPEQRRKRYYDAAGRFPADFDLQKHLLRAQLGWEYRLAWAQGKTIDFRAIRRQAGGRTHLRVVAQ